MSYISFLSPLYLWFLPLFLIPLIIHLLNRQKVKKIRFSSTRFFEQSTIKKSRIKKLSNLILLIVRTLIILLIVFLFSSPFLGDRDFKQLSSEKPLVYCWIDPSVSMFYKTKNKTIKNHAGNLIKLAEKTLSSPKIMIYNTESKRFINSSNRDINSPDFLKPNFGKSDFSQMVNELNSELKKISNNSRNVTLILFSDFQKEITPFINSYIDTISLDKISIISVSLTPKKIVNRSTVLRKNSNDRLSVNISSKSNSKKIMLSLVSNGIRKWHKSIGRSSPFDTILNIPLPEKLGIFKLLFDRDDNFSYDNQLLFAREKNSLSKILLIENSEVFSPLFEALSTLSEDYFSIKRVSSKDVTYENIDSANLTILNSISQTNRALNALFSGNGYKNRTVLFSPNITAKNAPFQQGLLRRLSSSSPDSIITRKDNTTPSITISRDDLWRGFKSRNITNIQIYSQIYSLPGKPLLCLTDNMPLITTIVDSKNNNWILSSTPLDISEFNTFSQSGFYLPILDRLLRFGLNKNSHGSIELFAGLPFSNPLFRSGERVTIIDTKDNASFSVLNQKLLTINAPGIYKIKTDKKSKTIAVNINPKELSLEYKSLAISNKKELKVLTAQQFENFILSLQQNHFSPILISLILILILCELILSMQIKRKISTKPA